MIDEIFDRQYQAGREPLHDGIERGLARLANFFDTTFKAVHEVQFEAPWARRPAKISKNIRCA